MKSPFTGNEMTTHTEWRKMSFRKEEFDICFHYYQCEDTREQFEDDYFSELNYNQLINQYRSKYNIPFPEKIISIRKKYGISAAKMSEILGFGINVYRQYELGEVPNQSNAKLILLSENPHEFLKLLDISKIRDQIFVNKLVSKIRILLEEVKRISHEAHFEKYIFGKTYPNLFNGYRNPNLNKITEMIAYFAKHNQPWKTQLNKLLFYSDFEMFKRQSQSISGLEYQAIKFGPVPVNYNTLFEFTYRLGKVDILEENIKEIDIAERFISVPDYKFDNSLFSEEELRVLNYVSNKFKNSPVKKIVEKSHNEIAWKNNIDDKGIINYNYSFYLNY